MNTVSFPPERVQTQRGPPVTAGSPTCRGTLDRRGMEAETGSRRGNSPAQIRADLARTMRALGGELEHPPADQGPAAANLRSGSQRVGAAAGRAIRDHAIVVNKIPTSIDGTDARSRAHFRLFELAPDGNCSNAQQHASNCSNALKQKVSLDPVVQAILAGLQEHTVSLTRAVSCPRRRITPEVASWVCPRVHQLRRMLTTVNLSHNPLRMVGLLHLMRAIGDAQHLKSIVLCNSELDLARELSFVRTGSVLEERPPTSENGGSKKPQSTLHRSDKSRPTTREDSIEAEPGESELRQLVDSKGRKLVFNESLLSMNVFGELQEAPEEEAGEDNDERDLVVGESRDSRHAALLLKTFLQECSSLEHLDLSQNRLGLCGVEMIQIASQNAAKGISSTLRYLNLSSGLIGVQGAGMCLQQVMSSCKALTHLDISHNAIRGQDAVDVVDGMRLCKSLEDLIAAHNGFGEREPAEALGHLLKSPDAPNLRNLDLGFNRFGGMRLGEWPTKYQEDSRFKFVLLALDSLLPMLHRWGEGQDPAKAMVPPTAKSVNGDVLLPGEFHCYRAVYKELGVLLDEEVTNMQAQMAGEQVCVHGQRQTECSECGIFGGSVTHLLSAISERTNRRLLTNLNLAGNLFSEEMVGTILHVLSKVIRQSSVEIESIQFESLLNDDVHATVLLQRDQKLPKSSFNADGYIVLDLQPEKRKMVLDCGLYMLELQTVTNLTLKHFCESGLKFDRMSKRPKEFIRMIGCRTFSYIPAEQFSFERELQQRILSKLETSSKSIPGISPLSTIHGQASFETGLRARLNPQRLADSHEQMLAEKLGVEGHDERQRTTEHARDVNDQSIPPVNTKTALRIRHIGKTVDSEALSSSNGQRGPQDLGPEPPAFTSIRTELPPLLTGNCEDLSHVLGEPIGSIAMKTSPRRVSNSRPSTLASSMVEDGSDRAERKLKLKNAKKDKLRRKSKAQWKLASSQIFRGNANHAATPQPAPDQVEQEVDGEPSGDALHADPEGQDAHYRAHTTLPTFACAERIDIESGPSEFFSILHPVQRDGTYQARPNFFDGSGSPSIDQELMSLQLRGDLINLASVAAANAKDKLDTFWDTVSAIREAMPSLTDSWVTAKIECPERHVIGEPFCFEYSYKGSERRAPGSYKMDWIGLYQITDEMSFQQANSTPEKVSFCRVVAKFRPPNDANAQIQLRHIIWEPGLYQLHMNLVNSERIIGSGPAIRVNYALATLTCPRQVSNDAFELKYMLDYQHLVHPVTDWIGIFPKNTPFYTRDFALQRLIVGPKNIGIIEIEPAELETHCEICYFQDFGTCERIIAKIEISRVSKAPLSVAELDQKAGKRSLKRESRVPPEERSGSRHLRFYVSGTFSDLQEERALMHGEVMDKLRPLCDARRISVSFVDVRHGLDDEDLCDRISSVSDETYLDRCLSEIDNCVPYFICVIGQVYGDVPRKLPPLSEEMLPWLSEVRWKNKAVTSGVRMSMTEMEVLTATGHEQSQCKDARFYMRDPSFSANKDSSFKDSEDWQKHAMNFLKAKIKRNIEGSQKNDLNRCMALRSYHQPAGFASMLLRDVLEICEREYSTSTVPNDSQLFWTQIDSESGHQRHFHRVKPRIIPAYFQGTMEIVKLIDSELHDDAEDSRRMILTGASGSGKSAALTQWVYRKVHSNALIEMEEQFQQNLRKKRTNVASLSKLLGKMGALSKISTDQVAEPAPAPKENEAKGLGVFATCVKKGQTVKEMMDEAKATTAAPDGTQDLPMSPEMASPIDLRRKPDEGPERMCFTWYKNLRDKEIAVMYLHCGVHQQIRNGFDVLRTLVISLYTAFDLHVTDEQVLNHRLRTTLNKRLQDFPPGRWTVYFVLDGLDRVVSNDAIEDWMPKTKQPNIHWLLATSDIKQVAALQGKRYALHEISVPQLTIEQRKSLLTSGMTRNGIRYKPELLEQLANIPLSENPGFLVCSLDALRTCVRSNAVEELVGQADPVPGPEETTEEVVEHAKPSLRKCASIEQCYDLVLKCWTGTVPGAKLAMSLLSLVETGLYEYEIMRLLRCPVEVSAIEWTSVLKILHESTYTHSGVVQIFNVKMFDYFKKNHLDKNSRKDALFRLEQYFGNLPTCNRKLDEYAYVLEKLKAWSQMYNYVTDIVIFHQYYSDPTRRVMFLGYMEALNKTSDEVQSSLRHNFEMHFQLDRRWFCSEGAFYYELNPRIYKSVKSLFSFQDIVYTLSSYFELNGKHEDCIRDLEAALKSLFGISDLFQIPKCKPEACTFPDRVAKILCRLVKIYCVHLEALVEHWLAAGADGVPKRQIPESCRGLDVSWWATPVPVGRARTLPHKLKLVFAVNHALSQHGSMDHNLANSIEDIHSFERKFGHLSDLQWNSGLERFERLPQHSSDNPMMWGKTLRDPISLRPLPVRMNYPHALILPAGYERRHRKDVLSAADAKGSFVLEKRGVHKETSMTWSEKSGPERAVIRRKQEHESSPGVLPSISTVQQ